jgi:hypothetical protein
MRKCKQTDRLMLSILISINKFYFKVSIGNQLLTVTRISLWILTILTIRINIPKINPFSRSNRALTPTEYQWINTELHNQSSPHESKTHLHSKAWMSLSHLLIYIWGNQIKQFKFQINFAKLMVIMELRCLRIYQWLLENLCKSLIRMEETDCD